MPLLLAGAVLLLLLYSCVFRVGEDQLALRMHFGSEAGAARLEPGLHFKWPWGIDEVLRFDRRVQAQIIAAEPMQTRDGSALRADITLYWQIVDPALFQRLAGGSSAEASGQLGQKVRESIRGKISGMDWPAALAVDPAALSEAAVQSAQDAANAIGVRLRAVELAGLTPGDELGGKVLERMRRFFGDQAAKVRGAGADEARRIRADADTQRDELLAKAAREAEAVRGEADAQALRTLARAFGRQTEFAAFWRSLQAYRRTLGGDGVLVLGPDSDFFKYLRAAGKRQE